MLTHFFFWSKGYDGVKVDNNEWFKFIISCLNFRC